MARRLFILGAGLQLLLGLSSCGGNHDSNPELGVVLLTTTAVPSDVQCISLTAVGSGSTVTRNFDVSPSQVSNLTATGLPTGIVTLTENAYNAPCSQVTGSTPPTWVSEAPVTVQLIPGQATPVSIVLRRAGQAIITTTFADNVDGGTGSTDGGAGYDAPVAANTIGGLPTANSSMERVKVIGADGKQYIVQNNNWGNPTGSTQMLSYAANTFKVLSSTGSGTSAPASFPSIYVGQNGNVGGGAFQTTDSNLPIQLSSLQIAPTAFAWSGGTPSGDYNAAYDVWFAKTVPVAGSYNDAISGELMIWLYKPASRQPIGSVKRTVTLAGHSWNVWVGPKGSTSAGTDDANRPVVTYVAQDSPVPSLSFDLKTFVSDAVANGSADQSAGGTSQAFASSWYLTDVFGGFQIWTGSNATGLQCTNFTVAVTSIGGGGTDGGTSSADGGTGIDAPVAANTIGGLPTANSSMERVKVIGADGKQYIVQNNNWGNPTGSTQLLSYAANTFKVVSSTGSGTSAPASFPSIYVGQNGNVGGGAFQTTDSNLPMQVSSLQIAPTAFAWSGGTPAGDYNAAYDVWFAKTVPVAGSYNDAISGELMIWLYKPASRQPIGSVKRTVTLAGHSWNVWVGPKGSTSTGTDDANRPVVTYVAQDSPVPSLSFDLKTFISDAVANGSADQAAGGTSQAFTSSWYLTDVFGGFQIWTGSNATGLQCTNFTVAVTSIGGGGTDGGTSSADGGTGIDAPVAANTIGGLPTANSSMERVKVIGADGKQYIVQNNNWGNPTGSTQMLSYAANTFKVLSSTGSGTSAPASFPSIYVGQNGNVGGGAFQTTDSNLPIQLSSLQIAPTAFAWSGGTPAGDFNAAYDVWFAKTVPVAGSYNDAISGELMIWLYKPASRQPIGSVKRTVTLAGHSWNVWVGPKGSTSTGTDDANRPVVTYVAQDSPVPSLSFDLKTFVSDAVANGSADQAAGGTSQAFASSWYLTDVFGGFQIWTGSNATGLQCTNFTVATQAIPANMPPTIATAASASPSPVTGATTALSVLGADDNGEANLTYTWATTGTPPASVSFSANGTNVAKNTTATFTTAGNYAFLVTAKDQGNLTVTSAVSVTVNQTLTTIVVAPASATVAASAAQQLTATARDQFAANLATQPTLAWTTSGGGTISATGLFTAGTTAGGPYTVTAKNGTISGTASVTVTSSPTTIYQINCGSSSAVSPFAADAYSSGGTMHTVTNTITTTGVTKPAPAAVYQSERYGASTYTLPSLVASASYTVRLHFAELYQTATGKRVFNVVINGTTVLSNFDIYAAAGGQYKAVVREFTTTANASGQIVIALTTVTDNATIGGIELIRN